MRALICLIACLGFLLPTHGAAGRADTLSTDPQWLRLIHWPHADARQQRDLLSPDFYLSAPVSPSAELAASLHALRNADPAQRQAALCRYPARAVWLAGALDEPALAAGLPQCRELQDWLPDPARDRLLVIQVTGYFGNPASAFGHLMLRIAPGDKAIDRGLLDRGINFGARIPDDESTLAYIGRGLTGGYRARFSEAINHQQDHVYAATEARDMWAYELALPAAQLQLLSLHLWELREIDFSYYFLRKNCAWRIAELLALALAQPIGPARQPYYLPDDVFLALEDIDRARAGALITERHFLPSLAHAAAARLSRQPAATRRQLERYLDEPDSARAEALDAAALDYLLDLYDYRLANAGEDGRARWQAAKQPVLRARLARSERAIPIADSPPPARGLRPRSLAIEHRDTETRQGTILTLSAYNHELIDRNRGGLVNGALAVANLQLRQHAGSTRLERLNLVSATRLGSPLGEITPGTASHAWRFGLAVDRADGRQLGPTASAGYGRALVRRTGSIWLMAAADASTAIERARAWVNTGIVWRPAQSPWSTELQIDSRSLSHGEHRIGSQLRWQLRWRIAPQWALDVSATRASDDSHTTLGVGLQARW